MKRKLIIFFLFLPATYAAICLVLPKVAPTQAASFASALAASVTEGSLQIVDSNGGQQGVCPLKHTEVKAEISGFISRVTVTQEFENPSEEKIEAVYTFPLPQNAAVDDMTIRVGDRIVRGQIERREEARAVYEAARSAGQVAGLLDQERPNIFTQSVANIIPGGQVEVKISYVEILKYEAGSYEFVFPMVVGPRYVPGAPMGKRGGFSPDTERVPDASRITPQVIPKGMRAGHDISIEIALDAGVPIKGLQSKLHEIEVEQPSPRSALVRLKEKDAIPNKDFILKYTVAGRNVEDALLTHRSGKGGFFTIILQPPERVTAEDVTPKELVFVLDTSGSMYGFPLEKAKETMKLALDGLYPQDTFNLITFSGDTHILFPEPVPATPENLEKAKKFLASRSGSGGTEMMKAIRAALDPSDSQDHIRIVCFMTDGYVGNDMEIISEVQKHPNARVFAFGIGSSVNRFLLDKMAEYGRGEVEYVTLRDDGSAAARRFHERVRNPLLTNISIDWNGLPVKEVYPKRIPDLFSAKPVLLCGRYTGDGRGVIRLKGEMAGEEFVREISVELPQSEPRHDVLATLWARASIDDLMGQDYAGIQNANPRNDIKEAITQLGLKYRLMTQFTSFVAVEENSATEGGEPRRVYVPVEMPEGVSREGIFGANASTMQVVYNTACVVEVTGGSGTQVNTTSQELSTVVSEKEILELPTLARNPYELVTLSGNVSPGNSSGPGVGISINGQRAAGTNVLLDGSDNNNNFSAAIGQSIPLDSAQEFSIVTNNFPAEYGRASGGIVNVVTKGGTNEFHGRAYEFNSISALASNDFDNNAQYTRVDKGVFTRNQFGYAIGGPVKKDKMFFFNNGEFIRVRSIAPIRFVVPTADLLAASSLATRDFFNAFPLSTPINGRIFTVSDLIAQVPGINPTGPFASLPGSLPAFGQVIAGIPTDAGGGFPQNGYQFVTRFDWNISSKTQFTARHALQSENDFAGTISASPYAGFNTGQEIFNNNMLLSLTHIFTLKLVSESKFVFNRLNNLQPLGEQPVGPTLFATSSTPQIAGQSISFPGYGPLSPGGNIPFSGPQNFAQVSENLTYVIGKHEVKVGGSYAQIQDNRTIGAYERAVETLGSNFASALDNLVLGQLRTFQVAIDPQGKLPGQALQLPVGPPNFSRANRFNEFAFYGQDSFRISPRVTLNFGIRYEYFGVQHNKDARLDSNFYYGPGASIAEQIRSGNVLTVPNSPIGGLWKKDKNNFVPRLGFAWDIFGNGKTSLRGGYGIGYARNPGNDTFNVIQNPPNYAVISLVSGVDFPNIPLPLSNAGPLSGSGAKELPRVSLYRIDENLRIAYSHLYSISFEHQLFRDLLLSIDYSGSKGSDLYSLSDFNRPGYGTTLLNDPDTHSRINERYGKITIRGNQGFSDYHGLTIGIHTSDLAHLGLLLTASYTWSHAIDNLNSTQSGGIGGSFAPGLLDPFNPRLDKGNADFDIRHRFVTSGVWTIPFARNTKGITKQLLDGYELTYIFTAATGTPFTIYDCTNSLGIACPRLSLIAGIEKAGPDNPPAAVADLPNFFRYIDLRNQVAGAGSYANPIVGFSDIGPYPANMTGRNIFRGPGNWKLDATIAKMMKISERYTLQLRAEAYNLFNHANLFVLPPQAEISQSDFVPAKRLGHRQVQLAVKFIF